MATQSTGDGVELESLEILDITAKEHGYNTFDEYISGRLDDPVNIRTERDFETAITRIDANAKPDPKSFWHDEDDPEMDCEEVEEFDEDDMTEMAHAKLEEIKEMRYYERLAVWELPLLSSMFTTGPRAVRLSLLRNKTAETNKRATFRACQAFRSTFE